MIKYQLESLLENSNLSNEMSQLYSNHYGIWGKTSKNVGRRIKLSSKQIEKWLQNDNSYVATAREDNNLIGYAIAIKKSKNKTNNNSIISWVTQLVVHSNYRHRKIGKTLLFSFWGFSNDYAWGIMSSNPYAIRALEKATTRRVRPRLVKEKEKILKEFGIKNIHFLNKDTEFIINKDVSKVNTDFPSDISKIDEKLDNVTKDDIPWLLGDIEEGWEWFAFTFNNQDRIELSKQEILDMLDISEEMAQKAYSRMPIETHKWASNTKKEIDFIVKYLKLSKDMSIADFGCGIGRHVKELDSRGFNAIGVDYSDNLLQRAKEYKEDIFIQGDCRSYDFKKQFDAILCLYDVIGSFANNDENKKILHNIAKHLKPEGLVLISVMNFEYTDNIAKYRFSLKNEANRLLELCASDIMEKSGDIFNPEYFMIESGTHIIYRKEQFKIGNELPQEFIIRDYRYTKEEITNMCKEVGLDIVFSRYASAKDWEKELEPTKAKEILILCRKRSDK